MACSGTSVIGIFLSWAKAKAMSKPAQIQQQVQLAPYNSFGVPARAAHFADVRSVDELRSALDFASDNTLPVYILGGGSNVLFINDYPGLICHMNIRGITRLPEPGSVRASCGENWHKFVTYCMSNSLHGYENQAHVFSLRPHVVHALQIYK